MAPLVPVVTDGNVSAAALPWRYRGRLQLTVVVKARFAVAPGGAATFSGPGEIARDDRTFGGLPARSVEVAADVALYRARCDVTFVGHAHATEGRAATAGSVRLGLARDGRTLLDKVLHVFGDRGAGGAPEPWTKLPLVYERALGGPGEPNPVGVPAPNVVDPTDARRPAGFAPISRFWPSRKRLVARVARGALEAPIAEVPDDLAWDYFQAAPADQQIEPLRGGEWLVLDGLHPTLARVQTRLPEARGAARVLVALAGAAPREQPVELACDTLAIDGDRQALSLVWRGRVEVAGGEAALAAHAVVAALEAPGAAVDWARLAAQATTRSAPPSAPSRAPVEPAGEGTMAIEPERAIAIAQRAAVPFAASATQAAPASARATPWSGEVLVPAPAATPGESTLSGTSRQEVGEGTYALRADQQAALSQRTIAPFALAAAGPPSAPSPAAGLPWAGAVTPAPRPAAVGEETMAIGAPAAIAPPPSTRAAADGDAGPRSPAPSAPDAAPRASRTRRSETKAPPFRSLGAPVRAAPPAPPPSLDARLRAAGASAADVAALLRALEPPPPPPDDD